MCKARQETNLIFSVAFLSKICDHRHTRSGFFFNPSSVRPSVRVRCVGVARVGSEDQALLTATLSELSESDLGGPLHSLVVPGKMHCMEEQAIQMHARTKKIK